MEGYVLPIDEQIEKDYNQRILKYYGYVPPMK